MLITKHDIAALVKFSVNIADADINPFILKAERTLPTLAAGTYDQFRPTEEIEFELYRSGVIFGPGTYREWNGTIWRALTNTSAVPGTNDAEWKEMPLHTMFYLYLRRYLVFRTYDYFLTVHGIDVAQAGLTQQTGERFTAVSDARRKELISSNRTDLFQAENELMERLQKYNYLPAPDSCKPTTNGRGRFGIAVAKNRYRN